MHVLREIKTGGWRRNWPPAIARVNSAKSHRRQVQQTRSPSGGRRRSRTRRTSRPPRNCAPAPSSRRAARPCAAPVRDGGAHRWALFGRTHAGGGGRRTAGEHAGCVGVVRPLPTVLSSRVPCACSARRVVPVARRSAALTDRCTSVAFTTVFRFRGPYDCMAWWSALRQKTPLFPSGALNRRVPAAAQLTGCDWDREGWRGSRDVSV